MGKTKRPTAQDIENLTLPGDIPKLRRLGSPVYHHRDGLYGTVVKAPLGLAVFASTEGDGNLHPLDVEWSLDLSDPTGAAHMAWWIGNVPLEQVRSATDSLGIRTADRQDAMDACVNPVDGDPDIERIAMLRRVVLHVAGREVSRC